MGEQLSNELMSFLSEFVVHEIGSKIVDSISYAMFLKDNKKHMQSFERYKIIKEAIKNEGYRNDEIFRIYEVSNGYIVDIDMYIAKLIVKQMGKAVANGSGQDENDISYKIDTYIENTVNNQIKALARYIHKEFTNGKREIIVALYNTNSTDQIIITAKDKHGNDLLITYKAFTLRAKDLEKLNAEILMKAGMRIKQIIPYEVLPRRNGVSFKLILEDYKYKNGLSLEKN